MKTYRKYVVLSHGRTGSTILTRMLRGHSHIVDYQELFNVDFQAEFRRGADRARSLRYWLDTVDPAKVPRRPEPVSLGAISEERLLDECVWHDGYADRIGAIGFKVLSYQWKHDGPFPSLRDQLRRRLPGLRVVVLTRRNLLRQYLSHVMAHRIKQWHIADVTQRRPRPRAQFTAQELLHVFEHCRLVEEELSEMAASAESSLQLTYEELVCDMPSHWRRLQGFVDVPDEPLSDLRLAKLENRTLREAIVNYDELKDEFRTTAYESCFDE